MVRYAEAVIGGRGTCSLTLSERGGVVKEALPGSVFAGRGEMEVQKLDGTPSHAQDAGRAAGAAMVK
jgi:hypothetical protein